MFKKIFSLSLAALMVISINTTVFASSSQHNHEPVSVGNVIHTETGNDVVIKVNEDQSFYTAPLINSLLKATETCSHTQLEAYGSVTAQSNSYNKSDSTYCYRIRTVQNARCVQCKKTGFKFYGSWTKYKHSYPLFSSTCKECGYEK
ncbi:hypothetical protein BXY41_101344 [Lacrimispora xylanisolvens]|uniref:Uncharacterized protein n=1 Tax=Lacrimispora xylanisolvens TaxID=384636 RepID=A0A2S6HYN9_9FIRM|nr:hypothetical protein [Hungatella xylanolytica]MBE5986273.1 hypothetical protein [Paenibacillaceae bacterium]PPK83281.1 hypothetical protein BXY41_101344 [Hungatella xylanolytica]